MVIDNSKEKERLNKQISAIKTSFRFQRMDPNHLKLENQDRYIDQLVFTFRRLLKSDCHG
ncbi:TPA: hypothetical protein IXJ55_001370 [Enterococcus faecium]|nr:hypothetical protein [Enterococcus faecium]